MIEVIEAAAEAEETSSKIDEKLKKLDSDSEHMKYMALGMANKAADKFEQITNKSAELNNATMTKLTKLEDSVLANQNATLDAVASKQAELKNATIDKLAKVEDKIVSAIEMSSKASLQNIESSLRRMDLRLAQIQNMEEQANERCSNESYEEGYRQRDTIKESKRRTLANEKIIITRERNSNTNQVELVPLSQMLLAKQLRNMMNALPNKSGMVNFCFHSQPSAATSSDLKQPDDEADAHAIFDGSMDSMNAPSRGAEQTLDIPNYLTSMIFNLKLLNQKYMALCIEDSETDYNLHNTATCINLLLK